MCERGQSWKREHESSVRSGFARARELGRNAKSAGLVLLALASLADKVKQSIEADKERTRQEATPKKDNGYSLKELSGSGGPGKGWP